jgi:hypothetical protein
MAMLFSKNFKHKDDLLASIQDYKSILAKEKAGSYIVLAQILLSIVTTPWCNLKHHAQHAYA